MASTSTSTTTVAGALTEACFSDVAHAQLHYPTGWYTTDGSGMACLLFDPDPITVVPQAEAPHTAVYVSSRDLLLGEAVAEERSPDYVTVDDEQTTVLGGRPAVCLTMTSNGAALLEAGTRIYECLVLFDGRTLIVGSHRLPGEPDRGYDAVVRAMASAANPA
jgi:hypothetical protein